MTVSTCKFDNTKELISNLHGKCFSCNVFSLKESNFFKNDNKEKLQQN